MYIKLLDIIQSIYTQNNAKRPPKTDPWWVRLLKSVFGGFFNVLLWGGSFLCFVSYGLDTSDDTNLSLGFVLAGVVTLSGLFEYYQESKSADLMGSLSAMKPENVVVTRDGAKLSLDPIDLVPGDMVELNLGTFHILSDRHNKYIQNTIKQVWDYRRIFE